MLIEHKIIIVVAVLGAFSTLAGVFITSYFSRGTTLKQGRIEQAIEAYSQCIKSVVPKAHALMPILLYGDSEVIRRTADFVDAGTKHGASTQNPEVKAALVETIVAMRRHVIGSDAVNDQTHHDIERLFP